MSHLLASINPDAAEQIQPDAPRPALPDVGHIVVYHMRRGFGRQGRTKFPAVVQAQGDRGTLSLTVIIDANDFIDEQFVEPIGPGKDDGNCWEWPDDSRNASGFRGTIAALHQRIGELEGDITAMKDCVLGEFDVPKVSIIAIMQDFENRLRAQAGQAAPVPRAVKAKKGRGK